nr:hypothetical protein [Candidatus Sigynarchaeota archaeon]
MAGKPMEIVVKIPARFRKLDAWLAEHFNTSLEAVMNQVLSKYFTLSNLPEQVSEVLDGEDPYQYMDEIAKMLGWKE